MHRGFLADNRTGTLKPSNTALRALGKTRTLGPLPVMSPNVFATHRNRWNGIWCSPPRGAGAAVVRASQVTAALSRGGAPARWSGEALWSPLARVWPRTSVLQPELATANPQPGQCLLIGGPHSEPELLIAYRISRFASSLGLLEENPVLIIEERLSDLARCGRDILRRGAMELRIG
jgi:hypothetical protein